MPPTPSSARPGQMHQTPRGPGQTPGRQTPRSPADVAAARAKQMENIKRGIAQDEAAIPVAQIRQLTKFDLQEALLSFLRSKSLTAEAAATQISDSRDKKLQQSHKELATKVVQLAVEKELPRAADCLMRALREESGDAGRWYEDQYARLQRWAHQSLEVYRAELTSVLWPAFANVFISLMQRELDVRARDFFDEHRDEHEDAHGGLDGDIAALSAITSPSQLPKPWGTGRADVAGTILKHKYEVSMSQAAFTQLLTFLEQQKLLLIVHIINTRVHVRIYEGTVAPSLEDNVAVLQHEVREKDRMSSQSGGPALHSRAARTVNKKKLYWGLLPDEKGVSEEARAAAEREKDARRQAARARAEEEGKYSVKWKYVDQDAGRRVESKGPAPVNILPLVKQRLPEHLAELAELRSQVTLSRDALPSSCCYTVYNAAASLNSMTFTPDATVVAAGFDDSTVRVWDMRLSSQARTRDDDDAGAGWGPPAPQVFRGHSGAVYACSVSPDYQNLLSCSEDGTVRLWNLELSANLMAYRGHSGPVWDVAYAPLAPYFATASHDRTARLWSVEHAAPLRILAGHLADVDAVCFHKNSHYLATGSVDKSLRMWDVRAGPCVRVLSAHTGPVHALAFSPCGQFISSAGGGTYRTALRQAALPALTCVADCLILCSCGPADGTIIVWDVAAGQIAARLKCTDEKDKQALGDHIWSLDYSACGKLLSAAHRYVRA